MSIVAAPHSYPKGAMGLCPVCGQSKLKHKEIRCSQLVDKSNYAFQCGFPINGTCPNCIRDYCARHLKKHVCE